MKNNKKISVRVNDEITSREVRVVYINQEGLELEGEISGKILPLEEALEYADKWDTDLIEIATDKNGVSICKLMDLDKYLYQEKKKAKAAKASQKKGDQKEIKLGVDIADNDFATKEHHAREFLLKGDNVKVTLQLRGRRKDSQVIKDQAMALVLRFSDSLSDVGKTSSMPVWQGPRLILQINPR